ncbi:MAG: glutaminase A, partial [Pseudomonadota bacterium]
MEIIQTAGVPGAGTVEDYLRAIHQRIAQDTSGQVASYIPELAKADPSKFGIAIATVDGQVYTVGDTDVAFSIQSVSKPFVYGYALATYGREEVLKNVGVEPTGEAFNSIVLDEVSNRPFNPMVNAGAIAAAEMIRGVTLPDRIGTLRRIFEAYTGGALEIDEAVFNSEKKTGHRNRAIAYMMLNTGMLAREPEEVLDIYFRQCSIEVTCRDLAVMAATLANGGANPLTGEQALPEQYIADVLTVMNSCGMYNYAGQWSYEVGLPAKSGVSGGIIAVVPGQMGIGVYSPPLDSHGNSIRGIEVCRDISKRFGLHVFRAYPSTGTVVRRKEFGDRLRSKRVRTPDQAEILDKQGRRICVIEAQGMLYFGTAERLCRQVHAAGEEADHIVLDVRRVHSADAASVELLADLPTSLAEKGVKVRFANLWPGGALDSLYLLLVGPAQEGETAKNQANGVADEEGCVYSHIDPALEHCENSVLATTQQGAAPTKFALRDLDIFAGLTREQIKRLEMVVQPMTFERGQKIIRAGDEANLFFAVAR